MTTRTTINTTKMKKHTTTINKYVIVSEELFEVKKNYKQSVVLCDYDDSIKEGVEIFFNKDAMPVKITLPDGRIGLRLSVKSIYFIIK